MAPAGDLVGRDAELRVLDQLLTDLHDGQPRVCAVAGDPGIGKTALLTKLRQSAVAHGYRALGGTVSEFERDVPFAVMVDALDPYVESIKPAHFDEFDTTSRIELARLFPALSGLADAYAPAITDERYLAYQTFRQLIESSAGIPSGSLVPVVLTLDDMHWADWGSIELLGALLRQLPSAPILLALGLTMHQAPQELVAAVVQAEQGGVLTQLELRPFTEHDSRRLSHDSTDQVTAVTLHRRSGGNPFYLEQLLRMEKRDYTANHTAAGHLVAELGVPHTVADALGAELAVLPANTRYIAVAAAVAGESFEPELVAAAADVSEGIFTAGIDDLLRRDVIRTAGGPRPFRFRHPLVHKALYVTADSALRRRIHERCAAFLVARGASASVRAPHVAATPHVGDPVAVAVLQSAADFAARRAPGSAARWFDAALQHLSPTGPVVERIALIRGRAGALSATGQFAASRAALLEGIALLPTEPSRVRTQLITECASIENHLGLHDEARSRLAAALVELPDPSCSDGVRLMTALASTKVNELDWPGTREWAARAASTARQLDDPGLTTAAVAVLGFAEAFDGAVRNAVDHCDEAAELMDDLTDDEVSRHAEGAAYLAATEFYLDRFDESIAHSQRIITARGATGHQALFPVTSPFRVRALCMRGRVAEALDVLRDAVEAARLSANEPRLIGTLSTLALTTLIAGDEATALRADDESIALAQRQRESLSTTYAAVVHARILFETGDPAGAVQTLADIAVGEDLRRTPLILRPQRLELLTRCYLALGHRSGAEWAAQEAEEAASITGLRTGSLAADRAVAVVLRDSGEAESAVRRALDSASTADELGLPIEAAVSRILAAQALAQCGDPDSAVQYFARAAAELDACGAVWHRQQAQRELDTLVTHSSTPGSA